MPEGERSIGAKDEYGRRLGQLEQIERRLRQRDPAFITAKLIVGLILIILGIWLAKYHAAQIAFLLLPMAALVLLFLLHERVLAAMRKNASLVANYQQGIARLEDRWSGTGPTGEHYLRQATGSLIHPAPDAHPYARDLDLFGTGSLYQYLCTARTHVGRDTLAAWLLAPAPVPEIYMRHEAVRELAPKLDFREQLALAASALEEKSVRTGKAPESLADWSEATAGPDRRRRLPAILLAFVWVAAVIVWQIDPRVNGHSFEWLAIFILASFLTLAFGSRSRSQVAQSAASIEAATGDLDVLQNVLRTIEQQRFLSPKLQSLQSQLQKNDIQPSAAIGRLTKRIDWLSSADNWFVKILDRFIHWRLLSVIAIEDWRRVHGASVRHWLAAIGEIEALTAFSIYAFENPSDTFPTFTEESSVHSEPHFEAADFAHPLLPRSHTVTNSLRLDHQRQLIVISGPNMAGKSTFIRSVGINAVLAQAGAPVRATSMRLSPLNVAASICILDSLQGGLSRFYAEIMRLKHIDSLSRQATPVLFLLDELLSGTNSHDRRVGTESMVRSLVSRGAIGLVTTHDLALAEIADSMGSHAANYHFEDRYENGELHFEYKLTPGIVQTSNALQLMRSIGLEV
jgi:hypothetical protein